MSFAAMGNTELQQNVAFSLLDDKFCVAKLPPGTPLPESCCEASFFSVTRTDEETSFVCLEGDAPAGAEVERNWRCLKVQGPLMFSLKGVLVSLLAPLAEANVAVFAVSTYNTDYLFVKQYHLTQAITALEEAGHRLTT